LIFNILLNDLLQTNAQNDQIHIYPANHSPVLVFFLGWAYFYSRYEIKMIKHSKTISNLTKMKKILFKLTFGFISLSLPGSFALAQPADSPVAFNQITNPKLSIGNLAALENLSFMGTYVPELKNINSKAIKDFQDRYNNIENAMWFSDQKGFESYFVHNGFGNRVFYDKKGRWLYSLILHTEQELPSNVRTSIKSIYFDFAITMVEEVQTNHGGIYIVNLEDKSNIEILKVNDLGEINILLEIFKE
jgi:hypothetical protein